MNIIKKMNSYVDIIHGRGADEEQILKAENILNVKFAEEYKEYLHAFGMAIVNGHEFTGIGEVEQLDVVEVTMQQRKYNSYIAPAWYVIEKANIDGIVIWQDETGRIYQSDFGKNVRCIADSLELYLI